MKPVPAPAVTNLVLATEDQSIVRARATEKVFREVELGIGKETRIDHPVTIDQHPLATLTNYAAEFPNGTPERIGMVYGPSLESVMVREVHLKGICAPLPKMLDWGGCNLFLRG
ncbi:hypothetical protein GCM10011385_15750 [Nitratireductor aestuarii]|uniref:Uncharacterized protein n=1 Tax=Nitratireductor aestuarii TaxID=1735103 RepID=A0A916RQ83_9HYPH|nr:hypothetical protein GCM10011385_15750 [Nitratireductor aestuarii]